MNPLEKIRFLSLLVCLCLAGCQNRVSESAPYAELRIASPVKAQLVILTRQSDGLFTPDGLGGTYYPVHYWATLDGLGPEYRDPILMANSNTQYQHRGVILVDRERHRVKIMLSRVTSKSGELENSEPSPANGDYTIERVTTDPFYPPN